MHVMLVEDQDYLARLTIAMLGRRGWSVRAFTTAAAARAAVEAEPSAWCAVVADARLVWDDPSDVSGVHLLRWVASRWPEIPAIVYSVSSPSSLGIVPGGPLEYVAKMDGPERIHDILVRRAGKK